MRSVLESVVEFLDRTFSNRFAPLVSFLVLAAIGLIIFNVELNQVKNAQRAIVTVKQKQIKGVRSGCERTDALLAALNRSADANYHFALTTAAYLAHFKTTGPNLVILSLQEEAQAASWTPLVDCTQPAVTYTLPVPVSFTIRLPPDSALSYTIPHGT